MALPSLIRCVDQDSKPLNFHVVIKSNIERDVVLFSQKKIRQFYYVKAKNKYFRYLRMVKSALILRFKSIDTLIVPLFTNNIFNKLIVRLISPRKLYVMNSDWIGTKNLYNSNHAKEYHHHAEKIANLFFQAGLLNIFDIAQIKKRNDFHSPKLNNSSDCIAIGPGCGVSETFKVPSVEWFVKLAIELNAKLLPKKIFLYGGENDRQNLEIIGACFKSAQVVFLINEKIPNLISQLKNANFIISGDSGPGHLGGLSGRPVIVLSEAINPALTTPYVNTIIIVRAGLNCSPCHRHGFLNGCKILRCNDLIKNEDVFDAIDKVKTHTYKEIPFIEVKESFKPSI